MNPPHPNSRPARKTDLQPEAFGESMGEHGLHFGERDAVVLAHLLLSMLALQHKKKHTQYCVKFPIEW